MSVNPQHRALYLVSIHLLSEAEEKRRQAQVLLADAERLTSESETVRQAYHTLEQQQASREIIAEHGPKLPFHKLTVKKTADSSGTFEIDEPTRPGSPPVGRGATMIEAMGDYLLNNQRYLGVTFDVDESAQAAEDARRAAAAAAR